MSNPEEAAAPRPLTESDPNGGGPEHLAGGMGVSSERTGPVRGTPGEHTNATEDTSPRPTPPDPPPEQTTDAAVPPGTPELLPD